MTTTQNKYEEFEKELTTLINKYSIENESNTPDWVLARHLMSSLNIFHYTTKVRDNWYGGKQSILDSEKGKDWKDLGL